MSTRTCKCTERFANIEQVQGGRMRHEKLDGRPTRKP